VWLWWEPHPSAIAPDLLWMKAFPAEKVSGSILAHRRPLLHRGHRNHNNHCDHRESNYDLKRPALPFRHWLPIPRSASRYRLLLTGDSGNDSIPQLLAGRAGLGPATWTLRRNRSIHLSYRPHQTPALAGGVFFRGRLLGQRIELHAAYYCVGPFGWSLSGFTRGFVRLY
jgi:hypothetical protein